jgi:phosphoserine phosphatase
LINGEFTGRISGVPSFREGKITRLELWMAERGWDWSNFSESWFYSDSLNDLPLLAKVNHPVAVDPDDTLRKHAMQQGWPIMSLR